MANKKLIWIALGSGILITGGLFLYFRNKNKSTEDTNNKTPDTGENPKDNTVNHTPAPTGATYPPTPFANSTEGNKFRAWVNKNYSAYAKSNKLDPTGSYDNDFIRKAYLQYGAEYTKAVTPPAVKLPASEFKAGEVVYLSPNVKSAALYSYPENNGSWIKGTINKKDAVDFLIDPNKEDAIKTMRAELAANLLR